MVHQCESMQDMLHYYIQITQQVKWDLVSQTNDLLHNCATKQLLRKSLLARISLPGCLLPVATRRGATCTGFPKLWKSLRVEWKKFPDEMFEDFLQANTCPATFNLPSEYLTQCVSILASSLEDSFSTQSCSFSTVCTKYHFLFFCKRYYNLIAGGLWR